MSGIKRVEDLKVWQKSYELVLEAYKVTQQFPNEEKFIAWFAIRDRILSAVGKRPKIYKRHKLFNLSEEIGRMLNGLIKSLSNRKREEVKM